MCKAPPITTRKVLPVSQPTDALADTQPTEQSTTDDDANAKRHDSVTSGTHEPPPLSTRTRHVLWCFILLYQLLNSVVLACLAVMYGSVHTRDTLLWFLRITFLFSEQQQFLSEVHPYVSAGYALLALVFSHGALSMLWHSARRRRLCYGPAAHSSNVQNASHEDSQPTSLLGCIVHYAKKLLSFYRAFGLRGRYFAIGFFVREVVESALQTTQAYKSSRSLSNVFVNQSYGVLIFLNCFVCVALPQLYRSTKAAAKGRFICILVDLSLDFAWGTVIPLVVFWPYVQLFFDYQNGTYESLSPEDVQREVEFILVMATDDFILSTFPFMSSAANLRSVKRLLSALGDADITTAAASSTAAAANNNYSVKIGCLDRACGGSGSRSRTLYAGVARGLFLLYGVAILAVSVASIALTSSHSSASEAATTHSCLHRVYPWLSTKEACAGRVIDCAESGMSGSYAEVANTLLHFDESILSNLVFKNCPSLEIPAEIHRFGDLKVIRIRDSEVLEWSADAALTDEFYGALQTVYLTNVTFHDVPAGFVDMPLAASIEWLALTDVDMSAILGHVGTNWQHIKYFYCDGCQLTVFPAAVGTMTRLLEISLTCNAIATIDERDTSRISGLENFWIDSSPLLDLPDALWRQCSSANDFALQNTNISSIPAWVDDIAGASLRVYGFGSPLCADATEASKHSFLQCDELVY